MSDAAKHASALTRRALTGLPALYLAVSAPCQSASEPIGPAAYPVGPIALIPTLDTEAQYRTNIYRQQEDEQDSWIYVLRPALVALAQDRENLYQVSYAGDYGWYEVSEDDDDNDYLDHRVAASADIRHNDDWAFNGRLFWDDLHEDRGTGLSEGVIGTVLAEPLRFQTSGVEFGIDYGTVGRARIEVDVGVADKRYENFRDVTRNRDLESLDFSAAFFYPVRGKTEASVRYRFLDASYPSTDAAAIPLDSQENAILLGATWGFKTDIARSSAEIGWSDKEFDDPRRVGRGTLTWSLDMTLEPTDRDVLYFVGSGRPNETTVDGDFINRQALTASWTRNWSDRFGFTLLGTIGEDVYENSLFDREDDILRFSADLDYNFRRWLRFYIGYDYEEKDSDVDGLSYEDHRFRVGARFSL